MCVSFYEMAFFLLFISCLFCVELSLDGRCVMFILEKYSMSTGVCCVVCIHSIHPFMLMTWVLEWYLSVWTPHFPKHNITTLAEWIAISFLLHELFRLTFCFVCKCVSVLENHLATFECVFMCLRSVYFSQRYPLRAIGDVWAISAAQIHNVMMIRLAISPCLLTG